MDINEDPRYKLANKEAFYSLLLTLLYFLWWYGFAYGLGSKPVTSYCFVMGLPSWFFWSCLMGFLVFSFASWAMVGLFFKDIPLDSYEKGSSLEGEGS